jgi:hypothetical protein
MDSCVSRLSAINDKTLAISAKNSPSSRPSCLNLPGGNEQLYKEGAPPLSIAAPKSSENLCCDPKRLLQHNRPKPDLEAIAPHVLSPE